MNTWLRCLGAAVAFAIFYFVDVNEEPALTYVKQGFYYTAAFTAACLLAIGAQIVLRPGLAKREVKFRRPPTLMNLQGGKSDITMTYREYDLEKFYEYALEFVVAYAVAFLSHTMYGYTGPLLFVAVMMPPSIFHHELAFVYLLCMSSKNNKDLRRPWEQVNQTWVQYWHELKREVRSTMGKSGGAAGRRNKRGANVRAVHRGT